MTIIERNVAPGIHRVDDAYVNWYALEDGDELTIVDAGLPRSCTALERPLRLVGRPLSAVSALVLTHAHFDHVGFAARLRRRGRAGARAPGRRRPARAPAPLRPRAAPPPLPLAGHTARHGIDGACGRARRARHPSDADLRGRRDARRPRPPDGRLHPGHTYGHCALHLPDAGAAIAGDGIVTFDVYTQRPGPRIVAAGATATVATALTSLDRYRELEADLLLPGHGDPWRGSPADAAEQARAAGGS